MRHTALLSLLLLCALPSLLTQAQSTRLNDHSDWWSILNEDSRGPNVKRNSKPIDDANFQIAGVAISDKQFGQAATKLGKAKEVERGDASTGRHQVCYQSAAGFEKVHLIFEFGEVEGTFYLFAGGQDWKGSELCVKSRTVSTSLGTSSGVKLGLGRPDVEAILGPPDVVKNDRIFYSREVRRRTTPEEFEEMRKDYPAKLTDEEAHKKFDFYDVDEYIEAWFVNSKLTYLAVSRDVA